MSEPKYKTGDRVTVVDYGLFDDRRREYVLTIALVRPNHGGAGNHRYYGETERGPAGVYENEIIGVAS